MRVTTLPLLLAMTLALVQEPAISNKVDLGEEFILKNGEEVKVKGEQLRITFTGVVADSRCPIGVVCVWAGNAAVVIEVAKKNKKGIEAVLNTTVQDKEIVYKQFKISLLSLNPYPKNNEPIDPRDYEAVMIVTKE